MSGYERMRQIIEWLDRNYREQPSLSDLAAIAGLSESQFHREFVRWTGITPKDFVQCLTLNHAKDTLSRGLPVLEASLDAGLSGPGRLHDLCVTLEAASPGEIKSGGEGLEISWGVAASPFGVCQVGETPRGLCHLSFLDEGTAPENIAEEWPRARLRRDDGRVAALVNGLFGPARTEREGGTLRAWVKGTAFQLKVWRALLAIPAGSISTYHRIATAIGKPAASRAVGKAIGSNCLAVLIPCHRVIRETGALSGYRWGGGRKRALLAWEGAGRMGRG